MRPNPASALVIALALSASLASGQVNRVLDFRHTETPQGFNQIATVIRLITDSDALLDEAHKNLTLRGTSEQMALAEWLFGEMDQPQIPAPGNQNAAAHFYRMQGGGENIVRVFYLFNTPTIQDFQGVATAIRATISDLRRVATYNQSRALAVRGTPDQMALTTWLVDALDRPAGQRAVSRDYRMPASADPHGEVAVRIMYTSNAATVQDFQQIATAVRTITDIKRLFTHNASRAIIARSTAEQIALADWLLPLLDKPAVEKAVDVVSQSSGTYEYDTPSDRDNMIRVFYLPQAATIQSFQEVATRIRTTTNLRRAFTYNAPRAFAVRGTVDQLSLAERMVKDLDYPK